MSDKRWTEFERRIDKVQRQVLELVEAAREDIAAARRRLREIEDRMIPDGHGRRASDASETAAAWLQLTKRLLVTGYRPVSPRPRYTVPPIGACWLLDLLLSKADRETIPGDLEEEFGTKLVKYGTIGARLWFWGETVRTVARRNRVCRWILVGGLVRIGEWIFRKIGS